MRNVLARWLISRSLDDGRPMPGWVKRRIEHDPALALFERQCRSVDVRLKADALSWNVTPQTSASLGGDVTVCRTTAASRVRGVVVATTLAMLVLVCLAGPRMNHRRTVLTRSQTAATATTRQQAAVVTKFATAQVAVWTGVWSRARDAGQQIAEFRPEPMSAARWLSNSARNVAESSGSVFGKTLARFHDGLRGEREQLWNSLQPAVEVLDGILPSTIEGDAGMQP